MSLQKTATVPLLIKLCFYIYYFISMYISPISMLVINLKKKPNPLPPLFLLALRQMLYLKLCSICNPNSQSHHLYYGQIISLAFADSGIMHIIRDVYFDCIFYFMWFIAWLILKYSQTKQQLFP